MYSLIYYVYIISDGIGIFKVFTQYKK